MMAPLDQIHHEVSDNLPNKELSLKERCGTRREIDHIRRSNPKQLVFANVVKVRENAVYWFGIANCPS